MLPPPRIHQALYTLSKLGVPPQESHPALKTFDAMQGDEYSLNIADMVVTDGSKRGLGFLNDKHRRNIAFTRAKGSSAEDSAFLIMIHG